MTEQKKIIFEKNTQKITFKLENINALILIIIIIKITLLICLLVNNNNNNTVIENTLRRQHVEIPRESYNV